MQSYNVAEAKTHLSDILERVLEGEEIILTRRGQPVARVTPIGTPNSIIGKGINDPNINSEVVAKDEWWQAMDDEDTASWYE